MTLNIQEHIKKLKRIQEKIIYYLDHEDHEEENYENIRTFLEDQNFLKEKHTMKQLLYLISKISMNHHRYPNFHSKLERLLQMMKDEIKEYYSSYEIFKIFQHDKRLLLFLIEEKLINKEEFIKELEKDKCPHSFYSHLQYRKYFFPEENQEIDNEQNENEIEEKQKIGENDNYICELIRKDLIEEFIIFVNKNEYPLNSFIKPSPYETNNLLFKNTTLIDYAVFFGSTQIFKYLYKNGVKITPSLLLYAIHGDNAEVIHLIEEHKVEIDEALAKKCLKESIKCHHNDVSNYIINNFISDKGSIENYEGNYKDNLISYCFHYFNFSYLPSKFENSKYIFFYACEYDYFDIVEYLIKSGTIDIKSTVIINN